MKQVLMLLSVLLLFVGCENKEEVLEVSQLPGVVSYKGKDINGDLKTCAPSKDLICPAVYGPGDQFAADCESRGFEAISCGCQDYICLEGSESGLDIDGNQRSCDPLGPEFACTTEFTIEDQFAFDCRASGREAVQCDCHDYICK